MIMFSYKIRYYDDFENKETTTKGIVFGSNCREAFDTVTSFYKDDYIYDFSFKEIFFAEDNISPIEIDKERKIQELIDKLNSYILED